MSAFQALLQALLRETALRFAEFSHHNQLMRDFPWNFTGNWVAAHPSSKTAMVPGTDDLQRYQVRSAEGRSSGTEGIDLGLRPATGLGVDANTQLPYVPDGPSLLPDCLPEDEILEIDDKTGVRPLK